jgi:hypothetical protein
MFATCTLDGLARGEKYPQRFGAFAIAVPSDFREVLNGNADGLSERGEFLGR